MKFERDLKKIGNKIDLGWSTYKYKAEPSELNGRNAKEIYINEGDQILFLMENDDLYMMHHYQDCCESVFIDENDTNIPSNFKNVDIISLDARTEYGESEWGSITWTFYKLVTSKGTYDITWKGESNGYYSERVDFTKIPKEKYSEI